MGQFHQTNVDLLLEKVVRQLKALINRQAHTVK